MDRRPWELVIDELYEMGGYAEYPTKDTHRELDAEENILERVPLSQDELDDAAFTLRESDLLIRQETVESPEGQSPNRRASIQLQTTGFNLAHDRRQNKQTRQSERSVTTLTLVLAVVGIAQAAAITAQIEDSVALMSVVVILIVALAFLSLVANRLIKRGLIIGE